MAAALELLHETKLNARYSDSKMWLFQSALHFVTSYLSIIIGKIA